MSLGRMRVGRGRLDYRTIPQIGQAKLMTDWTMQLLTLLAAWFSGLCTLVAAGTALWLGSRAGRIKLKAYVGLRLAIVGDGSPSKEGLGIQVTNLGERPVTIVSIGWCVGKGRNRRFAIDPSASKQCPKKLEYGETMSSFYMFFRKSLLDQRIQHRLCPDSHQKTYQDTLCADPYLVRLYRKCNSRRKFLEEDRGSRPS